MMPNQEKGFPPLPNILKVRFFSYKSLTSIRKTNYVIHWIEIYPVDNVIPLLLQLGPEPPFKITY